MKERVLWRQLVYSMRQTNFDPQVIKILQRHLLPDIKIHNQTIEFQNIAVKKRFFSYVKHHGHIFHQLKPSGLEAGPESVFSLHVSHE